MPLIIGSPSWLVTKLPLSHGKGPSRSPKFMHEAINDAPIASQDFLNITLREYESKIRIANDVMYAGLPFSPPVT